MGLMQLLHSKRCIMVRHRQRSVSHLPLHIKRATPRRKLCRRITAALMSRNTLASPLFLSTSLYMLSVNSCGMSINSCGSGSDDKLAPDGDSASSTWKHLEEIAITSPLLCRNHAYSSSECRNRSYVAFQRSFLISCSVRA